MAKRATRRPASNGAIDVKIMELVQKSGVLNKSATLDQIMALSMTLSSSGFGAGAAARWAIVSKHYVVCGDQR